MAEFRCLTVSDFNLNNFNALLAFDEESPRVEAVPTPFGQLYQTLAGAPPEPAADVAFVWTQPQAALVSFERALGGEAVSSAALEEEVDAFCDGLLALRQHVRALIVASWTLPPAQRGMGTLDLRCGRGLSRLLLEANLRLCRRLESDPQIFVLNAQRWTEQAAPRSWSERLWYGAKCPFENDVFKFAVADVKAALNGLAGRARKLLILDLDDTLWEGIVGEVGWSRLVLGGHDPRGEALVDFQRALKALTRRGILLGVVSKNDEAVALEAIDQHPEMILRRDDLAGWRINWRDKAANVAELAADLNLGLQSVVFIDDNPVERARVREALPEVFVPEWPADKRRYPQALASLRCFDIAAVTMEDSRRTALYAEERERRQLRAAVTTLDDWLGSLETVVALERLNDGNLPRAAQLLNKTNQMNMRTRRLTEAELAEFDRTPGSEVWTVRLSDRFGDLGLVGIVSLACGNGEAEVVDFLLSCRAMGRKVEETMLALAAERARSLGASRVRADYLETPKNRPCLEVLGRCGWRASDSGTTFAWSLDEEYPFPPQLRVAR